MSIELAYALRNGKVENIYRGDVVVINVKNEVLFELGSRFKKTYWRSSAKPFQILPFVEAGGLKRYKITGEELALMCSSHGGETGHLDTVRRLLDKIGFEESDLHCGSAPPMCWPAAKEVLINQKDYTQYHNCCSGKHSGMLAITAIKGYETDCYEAIEHPLQQEVLDIASELAGIKKEDIGVGVDGCGAPIFYMPILNMAKAYAILSKPEILENKKRCQAMQQIVGAMTANPWYVAGTSRLDTILMEVTKGRLLAKLGADGVYCVSIVGKGIGLALKIECGEIKAIEPVIIELLSQLEYIDHKEEQEMINRLDFSIYNHRNEVIGKLKAGF